MGRLAVKLSVAVALLGTAISMVAMTLNWNLTQSIGVSGNTYVSWNLWTAKVWYKFSPMEAGTNAASGGRVRDTYQLSTFESGRGYDPTMKAHYVEMSLQSLYMSRDAMEHWKRFFSTNNATGAPWQVGIAFWSGVMTTLCLVLSFVCAGMSMTHLYFYVYDSPKSKMRKKGKMYMVGQSLMLVLAMVMYTPGWFMMGLDYQGVVINTIPFSRMLNGKASLPGPALWCLIFAIIFVCGAVSAEKNWKTASGEFKNDKRKMKREMEKYMDSDSSDDEWTAGHEEDDSMWTEWYGTKKSGKKRSKKSKYAQTLDSDSDSSDEERPLRKKDKKRKRSKSKDKKEKKRSKSNK